MSAWKTMDNIDDLKRAMRDGISLTELRRRRAEATQKVVDPVMDAYRKALTEHLTRQTRSSPVTPL